MSGSSGAGDSPTQQFFVPAALAGERIDKCVATLASAPRHRVAALLDAGGISVNGVIVSKGSRKVAADDVIEVNGPLEEPTVDLKPDPSVPFAVLHEDDDVIVVEKPADVVVHPGTGTHTHTLVHGLLARFPDLAALGVGERALRPGIVHRIDKGTSGLLMVARTAHATEALSQQLSAHTVERQYVALAWGVFEARAGMIDAAIGRSDADPTRMAVLASGRPSVTHYRVVHPFTHPEPATLVRCRLETGRTHQIRVHLAAIGHPVIGDPVYGAAKRALPMERPFLHAQTLGFEHPVTGEWMRFHSPLPPELRAALESFTPSIDPAMAEELGADEA